MTGDWEFWIDRGGTFTDIVAKRPDGTLATHKLLSENPGRYGDAAVEGIRVMMDVPVGKPLPAGRIRAVKMGTTVATNALLERKGEDTLLLITQGFGDLLRIGYQNRPRLFDLDIRRPDLLYSDVAEIPGRLGADGVEIQPLDQDAVRAALQAAYNQGTRSVAIAFMHSYLNPAHETVAAAIARDIGFTQVSASHAVSRLIKLVGRGDTSVVDAYLSPILRRYVDQVAAALAAGQGADAGRLLFMQSNGGLTDAALFQGKDAILSGPAGGIVGMVRTGQAAGHDRLIGFDMGGTSTDVSHFAGSYERSFETEVAGVRMRAPMMDIHTVAAGGGSILSFRDGRYQVGPDSAGADPGPACYRRGGPLTVTDCNVMLGKLSPRHFPAVFGPGGDQPLDADIVRRKFDELAATIAAHTGGDPDPAEVVAAGFLRIAVDNMANAIKKISVQRGHDVTQYTLNCFGGAGGQHACLVADALGITRVFLHPFAGVLSAYGMGLAEIRAQRERQIDLPISSEAETQKVFAELSADLRAEVAAQGIAPDRIRDVCHAHLRYEGSHQTLEVALGKPAEMQSAFEAAHLQRFGFVSPERGLITDMISVEAIGETGNNPDLPTRGGEGEALDRVRAHMDGAWQDVSIHDRDELSPGATLTGPVIIRENTGTTVVEPGWSARPDAAGNLILERHIPKAREREIGTDADPVLLEVFNNLFMSVADQMGATLANTSWSVNIKERLDFSCAIFDERGDLVANAPHVPVHLGSMSDSIRTIMRENAGDIHPGDAFMLNSPYNGGTHLPDVTVVTPVFVDGRVVFWLGARGHHADIGGRTPGSAPPDSTHIDQEGVLIDNFRLVSKGLFRQAEAEAFLSSGRYPCRNIPHNMADLKAQVAANETGRRALLGVVEQFGLGAVLAYMGHVQDNAEACVREVIDRLEDGEFTYPTDTGPVIRVRVSVDHDAREAVIDFTGTSDQNPGNFNAPRSVCSAVVLYVFRTLVERNIPLNEGCLKPLRIIVPDGSMLNPQRPAAVISGNTEVSQAMCNALYGALGVIAGSQATMNNFVWGNDQFQNYETIAGGTGAGPGFDGCDAVQSHMTNTLMTDPEILEKRFPVRLEQFAIRRGSGGSGRWRGGDGVTRILRFLTGVTVTTLCGHRRIAPFGVAGGSAGATGRNAAILGDGTIHELEGNAEIELNPGAAFLMETPGGGGWGQSNDG